jgi:hypothetical protein
MNIETKILFFVCFVIFILFINHEHQNIETFINPCQYYQIDSQYAHTNKLKQQIGRPGIEVEKEKLYPSEYRAVWERYPQTKYQLKCDVDEHLNRKCQWVSIYNKFYSDLRGEQKNMISP